MHCVTDCRIEILGSWNQNLQFIFSSILQFIFLVHSFSITETIQSGLSCKVDIIAYRQRDISLGYRAWYEPHFLLASTIRFDQDCFWNIMIHAVIYKHLRAFRIYENHFIISILWINKIVTLVEISDQNFSALRHWNLVLLNSMHGNARIFS